jgi:predicted permease
MSTLLHDLRYGARLLWKDKAFAGTALLTLAVCIGANVAIFAIVNAVLLRPLPVPDADRIVLMHNNYPGAGATDSGFSGVPDYFDRRDAVTALDAHALVDTVGRTIDEGPFPQRVTAMLATPSFFPLIGVEPQLGRVFTEAEGEPGQERRVILSHALWQELYGGDASALGRSLRLNGQPHEVVGVMPRGFAFIDPDVRLWMPAAFTGDDRSDQQRHSNNWMNIGRMKPGATVEQVQAQVDALNAANLERFPQWKELLLNAGFFTRVVPLQDFLVRDVRGTLYLLWGGVAFVLLIGVVNLANLALARASVRVRELATRFALGASRARVSRQMLTESLLLTTIGTLGGVALAAATLAAFERLGLDDIPRGAEVSLDATTMLFAAAVAVMAGLAIGALPLVGAFRANLGLAVREEGRTGTASRGARTLRHALVVAQVGIAFVLLIGAGLLLASFRQILDVDPGFRPEGVLTASVALPAATYAEDADLRGFTTRALEAVRALPGVEAAGTTSVIPLGGNISDSVILAEGYVMKPGESLVSPTFVVASPGYLEAMGARLVRGRLFDERDHAEATKTIIVDERLANHFWPDRDPIGRRMRFPSNPDDLLKVDENTEWITVVGVVGQLRHRGLVTRESDEVGAYFVPYAQRTGRGYTLAIRTRTDPAPMLPAVRAALAGIDPQVPLFDVRTMEDRVEASLLTRRAAMLLTGGFGLVALLLAALGIYGVLAYLVAQRTREIGIRLALGSTTGNVFGLVLRQGLALSAIGLAVGLAGTVALGRAIQSQLYGVGPTDPLVLVSATLVLGLVALAACAIPATRASRVDPVRALSVQ